jgi:hypothetical protein
MKSKTETELNSLAERFRQRVSRELVAYTIHQRYVNHQLALVESYYQPVVAVSARQRFLLLNWRVWCLRYNIAPFFIMDTLFRRYANQRRPAKLPVVTLGLPMPLLTGVASRRAVEEAVIKQYPNGENIKMQRQPQQIVPLTALCFNNLSDMVTQYNAAIHQRQEQLTQRQNLIRRPYRGR